MATRLKPAFDANTDLIFRNPEGKTKIVWFVDYTDEQTRRVRDVLLRSVERYEAEDISIAVRVVSNEVDDASADISARAALAADEQGRFADMHLALFEDDPIFTEDEVIALAKRLGLDVERFKLDMWSDETSQRLAGFQNSLKDSKAFQWPAYFIDGEPFIGVWDEVDVMNALQKPLGYRASIAGFNFVNWAASSALLMIAATLIALVLANIGFHEQYERFVGTMSGLVVGTWSLMIPLEVWVNDGLMALFFLLVGIEIKHEIVDGELSSMDRAAVPVFAAIGGMVVPALIYAAINYGHPETSHGWGIPMATDIAFTLGILMMLGKRVPVSLKIFVSALAIADDLGAIIVIAVFYGHGFHLDAFIMAGVIFGVMLLLNYFKFYNALPYLVLGVFLWYFIYKSGVHATLAGVLTAFAIPSRPEADARGIQLQARQILDDEIRSGGHISGGAMSRLQYAVGRLKSPGFYLQQNLQLWCNYLILPIFAFFNTGILIFGSSFSFGNPEDLGTFAGLVIGKPLGICLAVWIAVHFKFGRLSSDISFMQLLGASILCGIGFTMSIFIASATFSGEVLETVKLSILLASILAAIVGSLILIKAAPKAQVVTD